MKRVTCLAPQQYMVNKPKGRVGLQVSKYPISLNKNKTFVSCWEFCGCHKLQVSPSSFIVSLNAPVAPEEHRHTFNLAFSETWELHSNPAWVNICKLLKHTACIYQKGKQFFLVSILLPFGDPWDHHKFPITGVHKLNLRTSSTVLLSCKETC